jgi:hypothetical protein
MAVLLAGAGRPVLRIAAGDRRAAQGTSGMRLGLQATTGFRGHLRHNIALELPGRGPSSAWAAEVWCLDSCGARRGRQLNASR